METLDIADAGSTIYALVTADVQQVATDTLGRDLTSNELHSVRKHLDLDWYQSVQDLIQSRFG